MFNFCFEKRVGRMLLWKKINERFLLELERVPDLALKPGPEEKLGLNKLNTQYYLSSHFGEACKFLEGTRGLKRIWLE